MKWVLETIKTTLETSTEMISAMNVVSVTDRVQITIGSEDAIGALNVGAMPLIYLKEVGAQYNFEAEPHHFGTRLTTLNMRILVPTFIVNQSTQYYLLERIKSCVFRELTKKLGLGITNIVQQGTTLGQGYMILNIDFTTETSYDENYTEGA